MVARHRLRAAALTPALMMATLTAAALVTTAGVVSLTAAPAEAASKCAVLTTSVHRMTAPKNAYVVLTSSASEIAALKKKKFTDDGVIFKAGPARSGLAGARNLVNAKTNDRIYTVRSVDPAGWARVGYKNSGTPFHVYTAGGDSCLAPVWRFVKGNQHRFALPGTYADSLARGGWHREGIAFYAGNPATALPPLSGNAFSIAIIPDTQNETNSTTDTRFANRDRWLVANAAELKLKFVTHTGDVVNWDTPDHGQYIRARAALDVLGNAGIPYSLTIGSHDTGAVCPGGSACPGQSAAVNVRNTTTFNRYLNGGTAAAGGFFEQGKVDNMYSTFAAGGRDWLVLNLELWPRKEVVSWARQVVASHPDANVIVATHSYLTSSGAIYTKADYGSTSPQYLYDNLIKQYANIRFVFSGHVGQAANRVDTGVHGNKVYSFLQAFHSPTNPVRLMTIDPDTGVVRTWIYSPMDNKTMTQYSVNQTGVSLVR